MTSPRSTSLRDIVDTLLSQGEPWVQIGAEELTALVLRHTPHPAGQGHMFRYLRSTTAFASDGDVHAPAKTQRFLWTIRDLGFEVELPRCPGCRREAIVRKGPGLTRRCKSCDAAARGTAARIGDI